MNSSLLRNSMIAFGVLLASFQDALAQGSFNFVNHLGNRIDAPVTFADGTAIPAGAGYTAQLYAGPPGSSLDALVPLFPTGTFRSDVPGYIYSVAVTFPGRLPGLLTVTQMRVYSGKTWESSPIRGESNLLELTLGGGGGLPPTNLTGLQPFSVYPVPEPGIVDLVIAGGAVLLGARRRRGDRLLPGSLTDTAEP